MKNKRINKVTVFILILSFLSVSGYPQGWEVIPSPTTFLLKDVHFGGNQNNIGFIVGESSTYNGDGIILKSTDKGATWTDITVGALPGLEACWFTSQDTGYIGGWQNYFAKTTDAGLTWTEITIDPTIWYIKDIEFWDADNGVVATADGDIFYTDDAGATWTKATGLSQSTEDVCYGSATTLYLVGTDEKVAKSTDGGHTWNNLFTGVPQMMLMGVDFSSADYGIVGGEDGKKMVTQDGGQTWVTTYTGGNNVNSAYVFAEDSIFTTGTPALIYKSFDDGNSWELDYSDPPASFKKIKFTSGGNGFVVGGSGKILRNMAGLTADFSADNDSVCSGGTINFTDESTGGPSSWLWTFEGGTPATSTEQNPSVVYNAPGTYDVQLEVSDGTTSNTLLKADMITVQETPGQPDTPEGDENVCGGDIVNYTTNTVQYADTYTWEVNPLDAGTIEGTGTTATFYSSETWTGSYTIKVKVSNMCGESSWSQELNCELNASPAAFNLSEGGSYCEGGAGVEITLDGSESGIQYVLYDNDGMVAGDSVAGTGSQISFGFFTEQGTYTSEGFSNSCSSLMNEEAIITINFPPSEAETPQGPESICGETTSEYTISPVENATSYIWTISPEEAGTISGNDTVGTVSWSDTFTGDAYIAAKGQNDCGTGTSQDSLMVSVSLGPNPVITGNDLVCHLSSGNYSVEYNENSTYEWSAQGGEITEGQGTNEITVYWTAPQGSVNYVNVTETVNENCIGSAEPFEVIIDQCVGINEIDNEKISVYPNPVKTKLTVSLTGISGSSVNIKLVNPRGQVVYQAGKSIKQGSFKSIIDVNNLPSTVYYLIIESDDNIVVSRKVVVLD